MKTLSLSSSILPFESLLSLLQNYTQENLVSICKDSYIYLWMCIYCVSHSVLPNLEWCFSTCIPLKRISKNSLHLLQELICMFEKLVVIFSPVFWYFNFIYWKIRYLSRKVVYYKWLFKTDVSMDYSQKKISTLYKNDG